DQDIRQFIINTDAKTEEQIEKIKSRLLELNFQLSAISRLHEGSGTFIEIKLPKGEVKGCGRPKGASNKTKTTTMDPSSFEIFQRRRKKYNKEEEEEGQTRIS
ncbi:uncharacterized protein VP01_6826g1, partial [Puccinia sorghi]